MLEAMKNNRVFYTPHQVASFYSIKKDTLLYYDRIGLFSPAVRKENGYRYYSADQLDELDTILSLRDLGFSIPAIKSSIENLGPASFISLLEAEEDSIRKKIASYRSLLNVISTIKASVNEAKKAEKGKLYTAYFSAQHVIRIPIEDEGCFHTSDRAWEEAYRRLLSQADGKVLINIGSIVRLDEAKAWLGEVCREVYATYGKPSGATIPAGKYAYMFFSGPLSHLRSFYTRFLDALKDAALTPVSDIYEELVISATVTRNEEEYVTKLSVRIH